MSILQIGPNLLKVTVEEKTYFVKVFEGYLQNLSDIDVRNLISLLQDSEAHDPSGVGVVPHEILPAVWDDDLRSPPRKKQSVSPGASTSAQNLYENDLCKSLSMVCTPKKGSDVVQTSSQTKETPKAKSSLHFGAATNSLNDDAWNGLNVLADVVTNMPDQVMNVPPPITSSSVVINMQDQVMDVPPPITPSSCAEGSEASKPSQLVKKPLRNVILSLSGQPPVDLHFAELLEFLDDKAKVCGFIPSTEVAVSNVTDVGRDEYEIEFVNADIAGRMCSLTSLIFKECEVRLSQEMRVSTLSSLAKQYTLPSPRVLFSNLPDRTFNPKLLLATVNDQLQEFFDLGDDICPAIATENLNLEERTVVVNFSSVEYASKATAIGNIIFGGNTLAMVQQKESQTDMVFSSRILFKNLPGRKFNPKLFLATLNDYLQQLYHLGDDVCPAVGTEKVNLDERTVVVEFSSVEYAMKVLFLESFTYQGNTLSMVHLEESPTEIVPAVPKEMSNSVLFSNLPEERFKQKLFLATVNAQLQEFFDLGDDICPAIATENVNLEERTVVVNFSSVEYAMKVLFLEGFTYRSNTLSMVHLEKSPTEIVVKEFTSVVLVSNLPTFFLKEHFANFLNVTAWQSDKAEEGTNIILSIREYKSNEHTCIVEFTNSEIADKISSIRPLVYDRKELSLKLERGRSLSSYSPKVSNLPHMSNLQHLASELGRLEKPVNEGSHDGHISDDEASDEEINNNKPTVNQLEGHWETLTFINLIEEWRRKKPCASWSTIYSLVLGDLEEVHILTNSEVCEKRRKSLHDSFRQYKRKYGSAPISYPYFCAVGRMRGEEINCLTAGHQPEKCGSRLNLDERHQKMAHTCQKAKLDEAAHFSKGAFLSTEATKTLIYTMIEFDEDFNKLGRNAKVWNKIQNAMNDRGFRYELSTLQNAFSDLQDKYKNYNSRLLRTGQGKISWEYWDDMCHLLQRKAAVNPMLTLASGSVTEVKIRPEANPMKRMNSFKNPSPDSSTPPWQSDLCNTLSLLVNHVVNKDNQNKGEK